MSPCLPCAGGFPPSHAFPRPGRSNPNDEARMSKEARRIQVVDTPRCDTRHEVRHSRLRPCLRVSPARPESHPGAAAHATLPKVVTGAGGTGGTEPRLTREGACPCPPSTAKLLLGRATQGDYFA